MSLDPAVIVENLPYLLWGRTLQGEPGGMLLTVLMALAAAVLALVGGVGLAGTAWLAGGVTRRVALGWANLTRAIPLPFLIFWMYFILPALLGAAPATLTVILALGWFGASSVLYTTLSGVEALPPGQSEAALAGGLSRSQALVFVLLPQAVRNLGPSYAGLIVALIKDTSLAFIINAPELTTLAGQVNNQTQVYPAEIFLTVGVLYMLLCALASYGLNRLSGGR